MTWMSQEPSPSILALNTLTPFYSGREGQPDKERESEWRERAKEDMQGRATEEGSGGKDSELTEKVEGVKEEGSKILAEVNGAKQWEEAWREE